MKKDLYTLINESYNDYLITGNLERVIKYSLMLQNRIFTMITKGYKYNDIDKTELESYNLEAVVVILQIIKDKDFNNKEDFNFGRYLNVVHRNRLFTLIKKKRPEIVKDSYEILETMIDDTNIIHRDLNIDELINSIAKDDKDIEILQLLSRGYSIKDIVNLTGMKNSTIRMRLKNRYQKNDIYNIISSNIY